MHKNRLATWASMPVFAAAALMLAPGAQAAELYLKAGVPGYGVGFAQPIGPLLGVRADFITLGDRSERRNEEGIDYDAKLKANRGALLLDLFPFAGAFRISAGATAEVPARPVGHRRRRHAAHRQHHLCHHARRPLCGAGEDAVEHALPRLRLPTEQLALGCASRSTWCGDPAKAKLSYQLSGPTSSQGAQQDIDAELAELRDGVAKIKAIPQITFGIGYSF